MNIFGRISNSHFGAQSDWVALSKSQFANTNLKSLLSVKSDSTAEKDKIRKAFLHLIDQFKVDGVQGLHPKQLLIG